MHNETMVSNENKTKQTTTRTKIQMPEISQLKIPTISSSNEGTEDSTQRLLLFLVICRKKKYTSHGKASSPRGGGKNNYKEGSRKLGRFRRNTEWKEKKHPYKTIISIL